ncbi:MAG TPA: TonB-dependent receptor [Stellaceae bacterium]|nr:TonB-dependent receptor [Stellaceae bacterium]
MRKDLLWVTIAAATAVVATPMEAAADDQAENIIVTGTRAPNRTALTSSSPVDVISAERLRQTGFSNLAQALAAVEPSIDFPHAATTPTSANTRPITLRGLSPDETLVLVNGKRWHNSAVLNTNFAVGRGSAPFDLSTIPIAAIDHVEILRDGAAAQYGSDAIAGVVNIILKSNKSGGFVEAETGVTEQADGANGGVSFNKGYALGQGGHLTVSGYGDYNEGTNRALIDQRFGRVTYSIGDPSDLQGNLVADAAVPVGTGELYGNIIASRKDSGSPVTFGVPGSSPIHPNGFTPIVEPIVWDAGTTGGFRGKLPNLFRFDISNTFGLSNADFSVNDTANLSLGAASPSSFDAGSETYLQDVTDFTLSRPLPEVWAGGNIAAGLQYRFENYGIGQGAPNSIVGAGSVGFPGLNPFVPVNADRSAGAGFVDLEVNPVKWLTLGAAGRYDRYSDFGGDFTWKTSARAEVTPWLALRGSASTGFRAPSLQQEYYTSVTTVANGASGSLVNLGIFPVGNPVAIALGATPLKPEKSHDYTVGAVVTPTKHFSITADLFRTDIDNRIALSDAESGSAVTSALAGAGISSVQQAAFFTNALNTRTEGYDLTLAYNGSIDDDTGYNVSVGYERSPTKVRSLAGDAKVPGLSLLGTHSLLLLTEAQPTNKLATQFTLDHGPYTGIMNVTRYGEYTDAPISGAQKFSAKTIVDLSLSSHLGPRFTVTGGILNVGNVYPDKLQNTSLVFSSFGGSFVYGEESPWGTAGRTYYVRLRIQL